MLRVEWNITDAVEKLSALRARVTDLRPAWKSLLLYLRKATERTFATEGGRIGAKWAPLTQPYASRKARAFPGQPILRATDAMFRSLVVGTENSVIESEPQEFIFGTQDRKARFHQDGTPRMAQRKILDVTPEDRRQIKAIMRAHLENQGTLSGFERI
jgi:phage gpG-like protein